MVIDCVPFFNEVDILILRLNILDPLVDRFVIEEASMTFSGEEKELLFPKIRDRLTPFLDRITFIPVTDTPAELTFTHDRDYYQKNQLARGLADVREEDILLFGDVDEIPNPRVLEGIIQNFDPEKVYHLAQRNFYAFYNMEEVSGKLLSITGEFPEVPEGERKWLGTKVTSPKNIPAEGIVRLRDLVPPSDPRSVRVPDGGWHFGYMGGEHETDAARRIGVKVKAAAHQEYNDAEVLAETLDRLVLGQDIFGRDARFAQVPVDGSYPAWLLEHEAAYDHLKMPPITQVQRLRARLDLSVGFAARKVLRRLRRMLGRPRAEQVHDSGAEAREDGRGDGTGAPGGSQPDDPEKVRERSAL